MTAPGGITKNWVLVTCDLKEGRCQVRSSYGVMTKVREQKLARVGPRHPEASGPRLSPNLQSIWQPLKYSLPTASSAPSHSDAEPISHSNMCESASTQGGRCTPLLFSQKH